MTKPITLLTLLLAVLISACRPANTAQPRVAQGATPSATVTTVTVTAAAVQPSSPSTITATLPASATETPAPEAAAPATPVPTATFEPLALVPLPCHVAPPAAAATILPHDVLLATQFELLRYHHKTGEIETLVASDSSAISTTHFASLHNGPGPESGTIGGTQLSPDRRWVLFSRYYRPSIGVPSRGLLEVFDLTHGRLTTLADSGDVPLSEIVFAPQGNYFFLTTFDSPLDATSGANTSTRTLRTLPTDLLDRPLIETLDQSTVIGSFFARSDSFNHQGLIPSPDGQRIAVPTAEGVRVFDLDGSSTLVRENDTEPPYVSYFAPESWSPSDHYLMLDGRFYEGSGKSVQDLALSRGEAIPNTFEYTSPGAAPVWTNSDELFVVFPGWFEAASSPTATIWSLHADREEMLAAEHQFRLLLSAINLATKPAQLANGQLVFALVGKSNERGLYTLDFEKRTVQQRNCLPKLQSGSKFHGSARVQWLPDGQGALYYEANYEPDARLASPLFYVPLDGSPLVNFDALLGETPRFATWILEE